MRFEGRLIEWNDARGFGFIEPAQGGDKVFVHIRAFGPADRAATARPRNGERLSFEIGADARGRKQARHVVRLERAAATPSAAHRSQARGARPLSGPSAPARFAGIVLALAVVVGLGWQGQRWWVVHGPAHGSEAAALSGSAAEPKTASAAAPSAAFRCDGRQYCSQMTSCAEATFFLRNCPDVKMDGNHDGVPCEQQWCTSPLAR